MLFSNHLGIGTCKVHPTVVSAGIRRTGWRPKLFLPGHPSYLANNPLPGALGPGTEVLPLLPPDSQFTEFFSSMTLASNSGNWTLENNLQDQRNTTRITTIMARSTAHLLHNRQLYYIHYLTLLSNMAAIRHIRLFKSNLIKIKWNEKLSISVILATFQGLNSDICPVVTILNS